jgi:hypothetical protein
MRKLILICALAVVSNVSHSAAQVSLYNVGGLALGQSGQPAQVGPTRQTTPNVVQAQGRPRSGPAGPTTSIAASPAEELANLINAQGGGINIHLFSNGLDFEGARNTGVKEPILYGKPLWIGRIMTWPPPSGSIKVVLQTLTPPKSILASPIGRPLESVRRLYQ